MREKTAFLDLGGVSTRGVPCVMANVLVQRARVLLVSTVLEQGG